MMILICIFLNYERFVRFKGLKTDEMNKIKLDRYWALFDFIRT